MTSERWEEVSRLVAAALELDPPARSEFLDRCCGADNELRGEISSLLEEHSRSGDFLERPIGSLLDQTDPHIGLVLKDRYVIEGRLASGGQGSLYRAHDLVLSRPVAVKILHRETPDGAWLRSKFRDEMEALSRIDHPGVVGVLDTGELEDHAPYLVIQYIEGETLRQALDQGPLHRARVAALLRQIGSAVGAAHAAGVAHRDLKPENLMLQRLPDGAEIVKVIDFGIAKVERSAQAPNTTVVMVAGTTRYMAPEQFRGENSKASDVFGLALIACEMLSGYPEPDRLPRSVGRTARRLVLSGLAYRPERRPSDVAEFCNRLAGALARGHRPKVPILLAALAVALAGGALLRSSLAPDEDSRVVEKLGGFDPIAEGFHPQNDVAGTVVFNPDRTGYEAWRVSTAGVAGRFDITVQRDPAADRALLITQIVPTIRGLEVPFQETVPAYHRYELIFDASMRDPELWVDGLRRLTGYHGHGQFQEGLGVFFGAALYRSERGSASFRSVRFEINP